MNSNLYCNDVLFFLSVSNWTWIWILCMFWIIALTPCEKGSYLIIENKLYLVENPLVHLISSSCWHFTTHETFHRPTHRNEGPVTDHVSSSPTPSNINIGLGDFLANPIMKLESLLLQCIGLSRAQKIAICKPHINKKKTKKNYHYFSTPLQMNTSQYFIEMPVWQLALVCNIF